jgi:hypothetical protein
MGAGAEGKKMKIVILFVLTIIFLALGATNPVFLGIYAICMVALIFCVIDLVCSKVGGIINNMVFGAEDDKE